MSTCELGAPRTPSVVGRVPRWLREVLLLALLYLAYSGARLLGGGSLPAALARAEDLLAVERLLHLDIEGSANAALQAVPALALAASYWYSLLHYLVTPVVMVWAYRSHHRFYPQARNALVLSSAIGLVGFTLVPMAPPRMLPGFVDTLASTAGHGWWGSEASAPRGLGELTNQLAAMPSLHVGWAVWVAWVVFRLARRGWVRALAVAYPVVTTVVVVSTANHYLLDAVAGAAVVAAGIRLARRWGPCPDEPVVAATSARQPEREPAAVA